MKKLTTASNKIILQESKKLFAQIATLINTSKENVLQNVNKELTLLN